MLTDDIERATHLIAHHTGRVLAPLELTQGEAHVLAQLAGPGALTMNDLHRTFGTKRSTLTSIVDRLEERRLAARAPNPRDRRSIVVTLTDRGRSHADKILAARAQLEELVRNRVSARDVAGIKAVADALASIAGTRA